MQLCWGFRHHKLSFLWKEARKPWLGQTPASAAVGWGWEHGWGAGLCTWLCIPVLYILYDGFCIQLVRRPKEGTHLSISCGIRPPHVHSFIPSQVSLKLSSYSCSLPYTETQRQHILGHGMGICRSVTALHDFCTRNTAPYHSIENWELFLCFGYLLKRNCPTRNSRSPNKWRNFPFLPLQNPCCFTLKDARLVFQASLPYWDHQSFLVYDMCMSFVKSERVGFFLFC